MARLQEEPLVRAAMTFLYVYMTVILPSFSLSLYHTRYYEMIEFARRLLLTRLQFFDCAPQHIVVVTLVNDKSSVYWFYYLQDLSHRYIEATTRLLS